MAAGVLRCDQVTVMVNPRGRLETKVGDKMESGRPVKRCIVKWPKLKVTGSSNLRPLIQLYSCTTSN